MTVVFSLAVEAWRREEAQRGVPAEDLSFFRAVESAHAPILLLHGAGGRPSDFHGLAEDFARAGLSTVCPLLPGHGLGEEGLSAIRFEALADRSRTAFDLVTQAFGPPAIVGQSVGAILGIHVALERPVPRLAALAPALRPNVARRLGRVIGLALSRPMTALGAWRWQTNVRRGIVATSRRVPELRCPLLVLHSIDDESVSVAGSRDLVAAAGSASKRLVLLEGQGHVLSMAPDRSRISAELVPFLLTTA